MLFLSVVAVAAAGYGDAVGGYPTIAERSLHLWTDAARVDPEAFSADYARGGCSTSDFTTSERTPKSPLLYNADLNEAARFHTDDMVTHGFLDHDSWDGTDFGTRVDRYYDGWSGIGENVAQGYADNFEAVMSGWMCSDGHRSNIMGDYNELGTGSDARYYTQDFGLRGSAAARAVAMAAHEPFTPSGSATVYASYEGPGASEFDLVLDGTSHAMSVAWGAEDRGIFEVSVSVGAGCHEYYVRVVDSDGEHRFPETGSYGWGDCAWDDAGAGWIASQAATTGEPPGDPPGPDDWGGGSGDTSDDPAGTEGSDTGDTGVPEVKLVGCSTSGGAVGGWVLAAGLVVSRRRLRRAR